MNKKIIATGIIIFIVAVGGFFYKSSHAEKNPINEYRLMRVSKGAGKGSHLRASCNAGSGSDAEKDGLHVVWRNEKKAEYCLCPV